VSDSGDDQVAYDLGDWDGPSREVLVHLLNGAGIVHSWEAGTLVVPAGREQEVDHLLDQVELGGGDALDPDREQVAFELGEWPEERIGDIAGALSRAGIPFEWDEDGDLVVHESDADAVDDLLDGIEFPDELPAEDDGDDGLVASDVLGELFVAADRLMHDAFDHEGVLALADAARTAEQLPVPFGFEASVWRDIVERSARLRRRLEDPVDDDAVRAEATELRNLLRSYV
jgi:hypothetical protein